MDKHQQKPLIVNEKWPREMSLARTGNINHFNGNLNHNSISSCLKSFSTRLAMLLMILCHVPDELSKYHHSHTLRTTLYGFFVQSSHDNPQLCSSVLAGDKTCHAPQTKSHFQITYSIRS